MTTTIKKVIWRKPDEVKIYSISDIGGDDEFIVAPFKKSEKNVSIKGKITEINPESMTAFFYGTTLNQHTDNHSTSKSHYIKSVGNAITAINDKKFEKVVLARRYYINCNINPENLFLKLVENYKHAFVYFFILNDGTCMIGATPENLLIRHGDELTTEALGGTGQINGYSEKEYLEHRQIISYISEKLDDLNYTYTNSETKIKTAGNVSHLSTLFHLRSLANNDYLLLDALHPTSAVCGLPYQPACDFIQNEEDFDRKYYSGFLGIKTGTDLNFYVNLRCAELIENAAILYAGAGINKDSDAESEWQETNAKLDTLLALLI